MKKEPNWFLLRLVFVLYCGRVPAANAPRCTAAEGLLYKPWSLVIPISPPGVSTRDPRNGRWMLPENARLPRSIQGYFTCCKSTTWDKLLYFPSKGRHAADFFALKNLTALAGFEATNLGTKGQHATSRPPKTRDRYLCLHTCCPPPSHNLIISAPL